MAQTVVTTIPANGAALDTAQTFHEIEELKKIVRFRDAVLAGLHPRFSVPANVAGRQSSASRPGSSPNALPPRPNVPPPKQTAPIPTTELLIDEPAVYNSKSPNSQRNTAILSGSSIPTIGKIAKSEINPILLEKSDDLIKAEIQLQRQRLERVLREQVEQRRISMKAALQTSESLPDFDLSDVLFKALTIVHPSSAPEAEPSVGARTSASDSFDENTFYSSQHDTPEQRRASLERKEPGEAQTQDNISADTRPIDDYTSRDHDMRDVEVTDIPLSHEIDSDIQEVDRSDSALSQPQPQTITRTSKIPGLNTINERQSQARTSGRQNVIDITNGESDVDIAKQPSKPVSGTSSVNGQELADRLAVQATANQLLGPAFHHSPSPPQIYGHDLSPFAPQPARVSPLITTKTPAIIQQSFTVEEGAPSQVTALRNQAAISSPESSPKGSKTSERKKTKKKKSRKSAGKQTAMDTPDTRYIKTEPKSPSPFTAAPLPRPFKRQRQTFQQGAELNYDEPRYESPRTEPPSRVAQNRYQDRTTYIRSDEERRNDSREIEFSGNRRAPREDPQYRRVVSHEVRRTPQPLYTGRHSPTTSRPLRAASHVITELPGQETHRYYREEPAIIRAPIRMDADRDRSRSPVHDRRSPIMMAPPARAAPRRIVVDEYGRQFYAPPTPMAASRLSVAPSIRHSEDEFIYERAPLRAVPRSVVDTFEEDGVVYRRASPLPLAPRRVITRPEYEQDYRAYRQREYSARPTPMGHLGDDYVRIVEPVARRQMSHFEEPPREYATRFASVRPDAMRYEASREFVGRMPSVRPDTVGRDYAPTVRTEMPSQGRQEFNVRSGEPDLGAREYIPQSSGYAPQRPVARRIIEDVEYIERPRGTPRDIYADEEPREIIYR